MIKYKAKVKEGRLKVKVTCSMKQHVEEQCLHGLMRMNVRGLLKVEQKNKHTLIYSGPQAISLVERMKNSISKHDFFFLVEQVVDITQKLAANGLAGDRLVLDVKNVFVNEITREMQFIYLPFSPNPLKENAMDLLESLIYSAQPMQEKDMEYVSRFVYFLKSLNGFDAEKIEKYVTGEDKSVVDTIKRHGVGQSGFMTDKQVDYYKHYNASDNSSVGTDDEATGLLQDDEATGLLQDDEATGLLQGDDEATTLLVEPDNTHYATLQRVNTGEIITINKLVFRLGKDKANADYPIDNSRVSRSHADIIVRGKRIFIMDLNSLNKTLINGEAIPPKEEMDLEDGDTIQLADEQFVFHE